MRGGGVVLLGLILLFFPGSALADVVAVGDGYPEAVDIAQDTDGTFYLLIPNTPHAEVVHISKSGNRMVDTLDAWPVGHEDAYSIVEDRSSRRLYVSAGHKIVLYTRDGELLEEYASSPEGDYTFPRLEFGGGSLYAVQNRPSGTAAIELDAELSAISGELVPTPYETSPIEAVAEAGGLVYYVGNGLLQRWDLQTGELVPPGTPAPLQGSEVLDLAVDSEENVYLAETGQIRMFHTSPGDLEQVDAIGWADAAGLGSGDSDIAALGNPAPISPPEAPEPPPGVPLLCPGVAEPGVSINDGARYTNDPRVTLTVEPPFCTGAVIVSNDGGFTDSAHFAPERQLGWTLESSGPERLPKIAYVRFQGDGFSPTFIDDIILDQTKPRIESVQTRVIPRRPGLTLVNVNARDRASGLAKVQFKGRTPRKFVRSLRVRIPRRAYLRVFDRAGNRSNWRRVIR